MLKGTDWEKWLANKGPFKLFLEKRVKSKSINFVDWVTQEELFNYYSSFDCFLFPSFHDSSGSVILEAYSFGLPVISLNLGGPDKLVQSDCGFKIIDVKHFKMNILQNYFAHFEPSKDWAKSPNPANISNG